MKNARGLTASFFRSRASYFHRACLFSRRKARTALWSSSLTLAPLLSDHSVFLEFTCYILSKSPFEFFLRGEWGGVVEERGAGFSTDVLRGCEENGALHPQENSKQRRLQLLLSHLISQLTTIHSFYYFFTVFHVSVKMSCSWMTMRKFDIT